jgi:hypothetical protein
MGIFRIVGEHVVSETDFRRAALAPVSLATGEPLEMDFGGGKTLSIDAGPPAEFTPIGRGLPLTIMIRDVYFGRYPKGGLFGGHKDVAVVSGLKGYDVFNASSRALNFIAKQISSHRQVTSPSALDHGTPIVAYSPAIVTDSQILTIEFAVDSFPGELFDKLSSAFTTLAGLPILLPYAGYIMGASGLVKLAGNLGEALFDGRPAFSITESIDFNTPGVPRATADFRIMADPGFDADSYHYVAGRGLVDKAGKVYDGDEPYVVISLDGAAKPELEKFSPTVASAAVLQRFFQLKDGAEASIDTVVQGIQLVSDVSYRDKALAKKAQIGAAAAGTDTTALKADYDALVKNISNPALRPA